MVRTSEYEAKLDSRKRITLRDARYDHYRVITYENGTIVLQPHPLEDPETISANSLRMLDRAVENMQAGRVSEPGDPETVLRKR